MTDFFHFYQSSHLCPNSKSQRFHMIVIGDCDSWPARSEARPTERFPSQFTHKKDAASYLVRRRYVSSSETERYVNRHFSLHPLIRNDAVPQDLSKLQWSDFLSLENGMKWLPWYPIQISFQVVLHIALHEPFCLRAWTGERDEPRIAVEEAPSQSQALNWKAWLPSGDWSRRKCASAKNSWDRWSMSQARTPSFAKQSANNLIDLENSV